VAGSKGRPWYDRVLAAVNHNETGRWMALWKPTEEGLASRTLVFRLTVGSRTDEEARAFVDVAAVRAGWLLPDWPASPEAIAELLSAAEALR